MAHRKKPKAPPADGASFIPRAATREEIIAGSARLAHRLSRHLDALEQGEIGAVDDVAAVLRILLTPGTKKGDDAIRRLSQVADVPLPRITVSRPATDDPETALSIGALPRSSEEKVTGPAAASHISVDTGEWMNTKALVVAGEPHRRRFTWSEVIQLYGNTFGSHLSGTIPDMFRSRYRVYHGQLDLGEFLIHCAGLVGEAALAQILESLEDPAIASTPTKRGRRPIRLKGLTLTKEPVQYVIGVAFPDHMDVGESIDLAYFHHGPDYTHITIENHAERGLGVNIHGVPDRPDWWPAPAER